jgi:4-carboxymuconolactone decarboxylase
MRKFVLVGAIVAALSIVISAGAEEAISRLPRVPDPAPNPATAATFDMIRARGGQLINLHLTLGHAGKIFQARQMLTYALRFDAVTSRRIRELTIMRTAQISGSHYEMNQHIPLALACGYTRAQLDGLDKWREGGLFDDKERALLAYIDQAIGRNGEVDDLVFAELAKFYNPQEIVELTIVATQYVTTGLLTRSLKIQPETDGRVAAPAKC